MPKERNQNNTAKAKGLSLEEILKQLPLPPPEHVHELKMEKHVKQLLEEQKKKQ
jgi:DNA-binding transcriptional MerR regulator